MGYRLTVEELVALRVRTALACGCDGIIASAHDNPDRLRQEGDAGRLLVVTPGVRMLDGARHDHRRSTDPATAIANGADYLVVGRPVVEAADRRAAALAIVAEMDKGGAKAAHR